MTNSSIKIFNQLIHRYYVRMDTNSCSVILTNRTTYVGEVTAFRSGVMVSVNSDKRRSAEKYLVMNAGHRSRLNAVVTSGHD